jgi:hypothetical protein
VSISAHPLPLRAVAFLHHTRLVNELAAGADPQGTPERAVCADQLTTPRHCRDLASALDRVADDALRPPRPGLSSAIPVARDEIRVARPALLALSQRLRDHDNVGARGVALVEEMIHDGASALYTGRHPDDVIAQAREALLAL